ncbi:hypothetical protein CP533_6850 [Ophiocordyceps camponoti-saundersi (nom. inval.)]|nr:hypothetical protein CP533_6850 [Ophiocordyceps camponoti-saundersi (nom. inval.)]
MAPSVIHLLTFSLLIVRLLAEQVQYCRFDAHVNFCVAMAMYRNQSTTTTTHDLYISMTVTPSSSSSSSSLGWTAIGTGPVMAGSLMFIIYGDAASGRDPIVSIRTVSHKHNQPRPIDDKTFSEMGSSDTEIRILRSSWSDDGEADVTIVCFACTALSGVPALSTTTTSAPWIWARNENQRHSVYSTDAELEMHPHHSGRGVFYVDMARSVHHNEPSPSSWPHPQPGIAMIGTSDSPPTTTIDGMARLHGLFMTTAFLLIFPLGVAAMRSSGSFTYHWILQLTGTIFAEAGAATGIFMAGRDRVFSATGTHGPIGVSLAMLLLVQALAGWRHHLIFVRIRKRTNISHLHVWLGRFILLLGWINLVSGLVRSGADASRVVAMICFVLLDAVALVVYLWYVRRRTVTPSTSAPLAASQDDVDRYFALDTGSDDEEDGGQKGRPI